MNRDNIISAIKSQHPVMHWWFAVSSVSFIAVYVMVAMTFNFGM